MNEESIYKKSPSFSLKASSKGTWQERAYNQLKVLYAVSKLLSSSETAETVFPKILSLCGTAFPLATAVLIEKRHDFTHTEVWHTDGANSDQLERAVLNARKSYIFLTGTTLTDEADPSTSSKSVSRLEEPAESNPETNAHAENYLVFPLLVDTLPPFGVFQLEGSAALNERDLEFVDALASLIAVAIDRSYKTLDENLRRQRDKMESMAKLSHSMAHVADLETERASRETFVSMLSHDLRTPLTSATMAAQLIQEGAGVSADVAALAARIVVNVSRADDMISDLLDANRIRGGEALPLHLEKFDFTALLQQTIAELEPIHGKRFVTECPEKLEVLWDRRGVRRIIENLCNNAIKYGQVTTPIVVSVLEKNHRVIFSVQNQGDLISPEDQAALFQNFHRSVSAKQSKIKGWGIGLTLVRGVAEAHGGTVEVSSTATGGTVFSVTIPIIP